MTWVTIGKSTKNSTTWNRQLRNMQLYSENRHVWNHQVWDWHLNIDISKFADLQISISWLRNWFGLKIGEMLKFGEVVRINRITRFGERLKINNLSKIVDHQNWKLDQKSLKQWKVVRWLVNRHLIKITSISISSPYFTFLHFLV